MTTEKSWISWAMSAWPRSGHVGGVFFQHKAGHEAPVGFAMALGQGRLAGRRGGIGRRIDGDAAHPVDLDFGIGGRSRPPQAGGQEPESHEKRSDGSVDAHCKAA